MVVLEAALLLMELTQQRVEQVTRLLHHHLKVIMVDKQTAVVRALAAAGQVLLAVTVQALQVVAQAVQEQPLLSQELL